MSLFDYTVVVPISSVSEETSVLICQISVVFLIVVFKNALPL